MPGAITRTPPMGAQATCSEVVTESDGDVHARLNVRAAEARESMRLIRALLASLPAGPLRAPMPEALPPWGVGLAAIESPAAPRFIGCVPMPRAESIATTALRPATPTGPRFRLLR